MLQLYIKTKTFSLSIYYFCSMIQHKVILSLGSNLDNRLEYLEKAIQLIHNKVGTVIRLSQVYESPAWGFESIPFYNISVLIHTHKEPLEVLEEIQIIEQSLGRKRTKQGYEARTLDIDIIFYDDIHILSEKLVIPHQLMHKRNFVLVPTLEIAPDWIHPIFNKNIAELNKESMDISMVKPIEKITLPLSKYHFPRNIILCIEGNIGSGKTTLASKISEDFGVNLMLESFAENPFLEKFYKNPKRFALALEMQFLADRFLQLNDLQQHTTSTFIVADYHFSKSILFAKTTLNKKERKLFETYFQLLSEKIEIPFFYIFLKQTTENLLKNIKKRGRKFEKNISSEYLDELNKQYEKYFRETPLLSPCFIEVDKLDFIEKQSDYLHILDLIQKYIYDSNN